jgi:23S rRNA (guanosine2251-2'-O)-methyltransferase
MKQRNVVNAPGPAAERRIYGVHAVSAWLRSRPQHLHRLYYDPRAARRIGALLDLAATTRVPAEPCNERLLATMAGELRHQGLVAATAPFPYAEFAHLTAPKPELLVLTDQMQDPHNLGAVLRTAEAVGAGGVILPKDSSVPVTAVVEAAAAGAAAELPVCRVINVARALRALKESGYWIAGLVPKNGIELWRFDPAKPVVIVVGGESGMRPLVSRQCDILVSIPMFGRVESLNASVAAAIALYHVRRQWAA